jgi:hypothetical protein
MKDFNQKLLEYQPSSILDEGNVILLTTFLGALVCTGLNVGRVVFFDWPPYLWKTIDIFLNKTFYPGQDFDLTGREFRHKEAIWK